jgi:L,D-peptidoglycan transpeptidase YkuD (ErfK/YbiS/YcfS/YnhG family)
MSCILRLLICLLLTAWGWAQPLVPPECRQLVVVIVSNPDAPEASLQCWQRDSAEQDWQLVKADEAAVVGRNGLAWGLGIHPPQKGLQKKEGDGRAPAGVFAITQLWLRKGVAAPREGFLPHRISPNTVAVDDPKSPHYNRILEGPRGDWRSHERMNISDYDRVLVIGHNLAKPVPGAGSCIFMHRWEDAHTGTSGCTALSESNLIRLIDWLKPQRHPHLVQLSEEQAEHWPIPRL